MTRARDCRSSFRLMNSVTEPTFPLLSISRLRMTIDGAGITTLIAGAGCPLSCRWCINKRLLREGVPEHITAQALYEKVKADGLYFLATGGGVTFGGGESLLHARFLERFRKIIPARWTINAETCLNVPHELVEIAAEAVDYFIVDIKDADPSIYRRYTGQDNARVLENLAWLLDRAGQERIRVRVPLIPDYNTPQDQENTVKRLKTMGISQIETFSYVKKEG